MNSREYRPEIDGLRALAVIPVVLFHLGFDWIRGGYLGVDVFFVISGFLITSIVLHDLRSGRFTFREFWARRIRRIFPPLVVMIGCTLLAAWALTPTFDHAAVGKQAAAALLSVANVYFWRTTGASKRSRCRSCTPGRSPSRNSSTCCFRWRSGSSIAGDGRG
jgi:peptidoglycan/LPS O-acetylase OafA/YrhL